MTKDKTAILFISGIVFFFGGIISFLHFFYHPQDVKGISVKREISVSPTITKTTKTIPPSASPSPILSVSPTAAKLQPMQQSFLPKKAKNTVPSSQFTPANWTQAIATFTSEESTVPTATDSAASSSAESTATTENYPRHEKADLEIVN